MDAPRATSSRLLLTGTVVVAFLFGLFPLFDFDLWGHLAAARLIGETGRVPSVDPFLWGAANRPWTNLYWGFQLGAGALFGLGGASLLVVAKAAAAALAVSLALAARRPGTSAALAAGVWLAPLVVLGGRTYERPEMVSLVMIAAFLAILSRAAERPRLLWALPALQILWVNCHPFFALGPLIALLFALDAPVARALPLLAGESRAPARARWSVAAAVTAACLVNPYGLSGALFPLGVIFGQGDDHLFYRQYVAELRPVWGFVARDPGNPYVMAFLAAFGLGVAAALAALAQRRLTFFRAALLVLAGFFGWSATRNAGLFALLYATVTIWNLHDAGAARSQARGAGSRQERRRTREAPRERPAWRSGALVGGALAALALSIVSGAFYGWAGEGRRFGLGERPDWYAHDAQRFLVRDGMPRRAFVWSLGEANLTLYHGGGRVQVFMDPRLEVAPRELFERYLDAVRAMNAGDTARWEGLLHRPDEAEPWPSILLDRLQGGRAIAGVLRAPGWRPVYADARAVVLVREEFAAARGLPRVSP
ncbi:MAG: hypothetical protein MUE47_00450 [Acidobacteria bacterium]|nr:hypothetical protein [Acidobacteriota bacterium]